MRPSKNDYAEYYEKYISKVIGDEPVGFMQSHQEEILAFFSLLSDDKAVRPYSDGKWSYKETFGHIMDTERVMSYRALCLARGETKALPGYDQDVYVSNGNFNSRKINDLLEEYRAIRKASLFLFNSFTPDDLNRRGIANNFEITVLALAYIIGGHEKHHLEILKKYFYGK